MLIRVLWEFKLAQSYRIKYVIILVTVITIGLILFAKITQLVVFFPPTLMLIWWHLQNNNTVHTSGMMIYCFNRIFKAKTFNGFIKHIFTSLINRNHWHLLLLHLNLDTVTPGISYLSLLVAVAWSGLVRVPKLWGLVNQQSSEPNTFCNILN